MGDKVPSKPKIAPIVTAAVLTLLVGTIFYHYVEDFRWVDSVYFCVITLTTIGYGDIVPTTDAGKIFTIFYVIFGISILAASANYILHHALERHQKRVSAQKTIKQRVKQKK